MLQASADPKESTSPAKTHRIPWTDPKTTARTEHTGSKTPAPGQTISGPLPKALSQTANIASRSSHFATSVLWKTALPRPIPDEGHAIPFGAEGSRVDLCTISSASGLSVRSAIRTLQPDRRRSLANARPMPEPPPVMIAILLWTGKAMVMIVRKVEGEAGGRLSIDVLTRGGL
jgi:hypothetical protein